MSSAPRPRTCLAEIDVVVLAGGLGTRLAPVVPESPKILAQVSGQPYLEFMLGWLRSFGARRVILSLGYMADQVVAYLAARKPGELVIEPIVEPMPMGTGGAVAHVRPQIHSDPALVMNGDSFVGADLCTFLEDYHASGADGAIVCTEVDNAARYGTVELDETSCIVRFLEKNPDNQGPGLINAGVYLLGAAMLDRIAALGQGSLEHDVFETMAPGSVLGVPGRHSFIDIGTPEDWRRAGSVLAPFMQG